MSYYTRFSLEVRAVCVERQEEIIEDLRQSNDCAALALDENGNTENSCKWYSHSKDMKEFSKKYPDKVFELSGEGEESGDLWKAYYWNGKEQMCRAVLVYPSYDPKKFR